MGVAAAAAIAGAATIGSGLSAANSQSEANSANARSAKRQRELEAKLYGYSRGKPDPSGDVSAILPYYGAEEQYFQDAQNLYDATGQFQGSPADQINRYGGMIAPFLPAWNRGNQLVDDISSGAMLNQRFAEAEPVAAGRRAVAQGQQQSILEALFQRTNQMIADSKLKGYSGIGAAESRGLLGSTIQARQAAANTMSGANLENALMNQAIHDTQRGLNLTSLELPLTRAKQTIEGYQLPTTAVNKAFTQRLNPFEFFRIAPTSYKPTADPLVPPVPNPGQVVGQGIAQFAGGLGNYYANQQLIKQMMQMQTQPPPGYSGPPEGSFEPVNVNDPYDPSYWQG